MENPCCAVLDCRRTGKPTFGRTVFVCTKHMGACEDSALTAYTHAASERRGAESKAERGFDRGLGLARFREENAWSRLVDQLKQKFEFKPGVEL